MSGNKSETIYRSVGLQGMSGITDRSVGL